MADNHNPLPKADRNSELQARSIAKFQEVLPVNLFVFRDVGYKRHINTARELNAGSTLFSQTVKKIQTIVRQKNNDEYDTSGLDTEESGRTN